MLPPIRCFTCNKFIDFTTYSNELKKNRHPKDILDEMKYTRYCCRRVFICHPIDLDKKIFSNFKIADSNNQSFEIRVSIEKEREIPCI